jgi:AcrR family transcriptional regulator
MTSEAPAELGRRERSKLDKRRRIREATREVFRQMGYEAATTREIAERADIAIGTLFAYAADKRELLMMVVNDDRALFPAVGRDSTERMEILGALMRFFEPRYRHWAAEPELSRAMVRETLAYHFDKGPGPELARFYAGRKAMIDSLAAFFKERRRRGEIVASPSPQEVAWLFMAIYQAEVRQWLQAEKPNVQEGLRQLRRSFELALNGAKSR